MPSAVENTRSAGSSGFTVDSFEASTVTADAVVKSLARDGGCFVRGLVDSAALDTMLKEVQPYIEADVPWEGEFFPPEARRTFSHKLCLDDRTVLNQLQE